jgi:peptidoglycan hydrolase-like protein with peptidoglycan-binding domain
MKVTKKILIEIIESELSLLTEENEKEALRGYFSLGPDVELKTKSSGRIVTALQVYLKARASQDDLKEIEGMSSTVEAMGDPDGNFGPKTEALVKLITSNIEGMEETGVYNSAVHEKIAGPAAAVEAAAEESQ